MPRKWLEIIHKKEATMVDPESLMDHTPPAGEKTSERLKLMRKSEKIFLSRLHIGKVEYYKSCHSLVMTRGK